MIKVQFKHRNCVTTRSLKKLKDRIVITSFLIFNDFSNKGMLKKTILVSSTLPKRKHKSSAPGEPPASVTGFLVSNIKWFIDGDGLGGEVRSRAFYSKFLEFGTSKMLPRPFMFPALEKNRQKIITRIKKAVKTANARSSK